MEDNQRMFLWSVLAQSCELRQHLLWSLVTSNDCLGCSDRVWLF
jgi:hypothetical protein